MGRAGLQTQRRVAEDRAAVRIGEVKGGDRDARRTLRQDKGVERRPIDRERRAGRTRVTLRPANGNDAVVDEPLTEAVMLGQSADAGISFTSRGRALTAASQR